MRRKMITSVLVTALIVSSGTMSYGASANCMSTTYVTSLPVGATPTPRWVAVANISPQFYLRSGELHSYLIITPHRGGTIDYVEVTVNIRNISGNSVKKWTQALYADDIDNFVFGETYKPTVKGKYYMTAEIEAYKGGVVIDRAEYESSNVSF